MKHLHLVCRYRSVSMERMTAPLLENGSLTKIYRVTVGEQPDPQADINYHVPWHSLVGLETGASKHVMLYTHVNPTDQAALMDACARAERIICMSFTGRRELVNLGADPRKLWVVTPGSDGFSFRRRNIGVVGFEQPNGRKRTHILMDLAWAMDARDKEVTQIVLIGSGWADMARQLNNAGLTTVFREMVTDDELRMLYGQMDALLVTGYAEGGPLPFLEAYASGTPVFAPRGVGFGGDYGDDHYLYGSAEELVKALHRWLREPVENALLANALNWTQYATETALVLRQVSGESAELQDGGDRYAQLIEMVERIKPRKIVEIGTWNGARAVQMIQAAGRAREIESVEYTGYDLFDRQNGRDVFAEGSKAGWPYGVVWMRLSATRADIDLRPGYTRESLTCMDERIQHADVYYIDGGHSRATIAHDWEQVSACMDHRSVAIFDDYYHGDHPEGLGCNELIDGLPQCWAVRHWPVITETNGLRIGMVEVRYADLRLYGRETYAGGAAWNERPASDFLRGMRSGDAQDAANYAGAVGGAATAPRTHTQSGSAGDDPE